jgi:hypothetical protein
MSIALSSTYIRLIHEEHSAMAELDNSQLN